MKRYLLIIFCLIVGLFSLAQTKTYSYSSVVEYSIKRNPQIEEGRIYLTKNSSYSNCPVSSSEEDFPPFSDVAALIKRDGDLVIDLNGYVLDLSSSCKYGIYVTGNLTIKNGIIHVDDNSLDYIIGSSHGNVTIEDDVTIVSDENTILINAPLGDISFKNSTFFGESIEVANNKKIIIDENSTVQVKNVFGRGNATIENNGILKVDKQKAMDKDIEAAGRLLLRGKGTIHLLNDTIGTIKANEEITIEGTPLLTIVSNGGGYLFDTEDMLINQGKIEAPKASVSIYGDVTVDGEDTNISLRYFASSSNDKYLEIRNGNIHVEGEGYSIVGTVHFDSITIENGKLYSGGDAISIRTNSLTVKGGEIETHPNTKLGEGLVGITANRINVQGGTIKTQGWRGINVGSFTITGGDVTSFGTDRAISITENLDITGQTLFAGETEETAIAVESYQGEKYIHIIGNQIRFDMNHDERLDMSDVKALLLFINLGNTNFREEELYLMDVNEDYTIDMSDVKALLLSISY